tara:strand:- start:1438 stop:1992 length:555 start_codon:yes stop_codon:yes gene_type:complete
MYIIFEAIASNDARIDARINTIASVWHHTIGYIAPEHEGAVRIDWLKATEISRAVAYAHHFTNALNGEVPIMRNIADPADIIQPTSFGDNDYEKIDYKLTSVDELNAVSLLKAVMLNYAEIHLTEDTGLTHIRTNVPTLSTLKDTQMFMATYFEWDCAYTANKEKRKLFSTRTFSEELNGKFIL